MSFTKYQQLRLMFLVQIARTCGELVECIHCGDADVSHLQAGHIAEDGADHYREVVGTSTRRRSGASSQLLVRLETLGWPADHIKRFQIECANCNAGFASAFFGVADREIQAFIEENFDGLGKRQGTRPESAGRPPRSAD